MDDPSNKLRSLVPWPPRVTHFGVSVTRLAYASAIFGDMVQVVRWRDTSFDPASAWVPRFVLPAVLFALAAFGLGLYTRISSIAVFVLLQLVYGHLPDTYALDRITLLVTFVFMFAPPPRALALDVRLRKTASKPLDLVPAWFALALLLAIEVPYANSVLNKLRTVGWRHGLTFWLTVTLPHFSANRLPHALKNPLVLRLSTYVALALEAFFPLVLVRPLRRWVVLVGVSLHLGIAFFLPIPMFGLALSSLYLCFVDWGPVLARLGRGGEKALDVSADPSARPSPPAPSRWAKLGYALPAFLLVGEAIATLPPRFLSILAASRPALGRIGLNNYGVYLDMHFTIPRPILRFEATSHGVPVSIPSFDRLGYPEVTGRYWCTVTIAGLRWNPGEPEGDEAMRRYVRGALMRQGVTDADISVYGRDVSIPLRLAPGLEEDIERRPWVPVASAKYANGELAIHWLPDAPLTTRGRLP